MILFVDISLKSIIVDCNVIVNSVNGVATVSQRDVIQTPFEFIGSTIRIGVGCIVKNSDQMNEAVVTNNRVACDRNGRVGKNHQVRLEGLGLRGATIGADCCHAIGVGTRSGRHDTDSIKVLSRNSNTIFIPNEMINTVSLSIKLNLSAKAHHGVIVNESGIINEECIDIDIDRVFSFARINSSHSVGGSGNIVPTFHGRRHNGLAGGGALNSSSGRTSPFVGDLSIIPTLEFNIQDNIRAVAHALAAGRNLNIGTESTNLERFRQRGAASVQSLHISHINARESDREFTRLIDESLGTQHQGIFIHGFSAIILGDSNHFQGVARSLVAVCAEEVGTCDLHRERSDVNCNFFGSLSRSARECFIGGNNGEHMSAHSRHRSHIFRAGHTRDETAVHIPGENHRSDGVRIFNRQLDETVGTDNSVVGFGGHNQVLQRSGDTRCILIGFEGELCSVCVAGIILINGNHLIFRTGNR